MAVTNQEIAVIFNEMADLLEIDNANPFRVRAYRTAALHIANYSHSLHKMVTEGEDLTRIPGIGADLANKIAVIAATGHLPQLQELEKRIPRAIAAMLKLKGLGPKRVKILFEQLKIQNLKELEQAAVAQKVRELPGFSEKTERAILMELQKVYTQEHKYKYVEVQAIGNELLVYLKKCPEVHQIALAGSFRRKKDLVGDLDILVTSKHGKAVTDHFVHFDKVASILSHGGTRSTVQLFSGLHIDLRVVPEVSYGAALVYFTGSKPHNIAIRKLALARGLKINEYGVFRNNKRIAGKTEHEVYRSLDLSFIEPELREDRGEIEASKQGRLPRLVTLDQIRGDLHAHTRATDGRNTIESMAAAAEQLGYEYLAITDHTRHLAMVHGQTPQQVLIQIDEIDRVNDKLSQNHSKIRLLKSAEVDILEDGRLDLPDNVLKKLDMTVCSIHSKFDLPAHKQTQRILRAMENRYFSVLGHPSGRLLNRRMGYELNYEEIFAAAKVHDCFIEINAQPDRLDLTDEYCRLAKEMGLKMVISTDAHSVNQFSFMQYGVNQARRGWLEAEDVVNTYPLGKFLPMVRRRRQ